QFLLIVALVESVWVFEQRRWEPLLSWENFAVVVCGVLYVLWMLFLPEPARSGFFDQVPLMMKGYGFYQVSWLTTLLLPWAVAPIQLLAIALAPKVQRMCSLAFPLTAWMMGGYIVFALHRTPWAYHWIPMLTPALMLLGLEVGLVCKNAKLVRFCFNTITIVSAFLIFSPVSDPGQGLAQEAAFMRG